MIQILIWSCSDPPQVPWTSCISLLRSQPQRSVSSLWHWNINQDGNKLGLSSWRLNEWGTISQEISDSWVTRLSPVHHIPTPSPLNIYINLLTVIMPVPHIFPSGEFCQGAWSSVSSSRTLCRRAPRKPWLFWWFSHHWGVPGGSGGAPVQRWRVPILHGKAAVILWWVLWLKLYIYIATIVFDYDHYYYQNYYQYIAIRIILYIISYG